MNQLTTIAALPGSGAGCAAALKAEVGTLPLAAKPILDEVAEPNDDQPEWMRKGQPMPRCSFFEQREPE